MASCCARPRELVDQYRITDGHDGSVPIGHALRAFNAVANATDRVPEKTIIALEREPSMPAEFVQAIEDSSFGDKQPLLRRRSLSAEVTIFQGGHEIVYPAGLAWLAKQSKP